MNGTSNRNRILQRIRAADANSQPQAALAARIATASRGPRPARLDPDPVRELVLRMQQNATEIVEAADLGDVATLLGCWLQELCVNAATPRGEDARLLELAALPGAPLLQHRPWQSGDQACVSHALAGVAETGSLVLPADQANPGTFNFLPDQHAVLLRRKDIVDSLDDCWRACGEAGPARAIHLVSGPSRTADIEQTIQLGAHGPRRLRVFLYD